MRWLALTFAALAALPALAGYDQRIAWRRLVHTWRMQEIELCMTGLGTGRERGRFDYALRADSCAEAYLKARQLAAGLAEARAYAVNPQDGIHQACYRAGWRLGFVQAHDELWGRCAGELSVATRQGIEARAAACRRLGEEGRSSVVTLSQWIEENAADDDGRRAARVLHGRMLGLVAISDDEVAWNAVLAAERDAPFSSLPCSAALALALEGGER